MGWDERLFGWVWSVVRRDRARAEAAARGLALGPEVVRLELIATALTGRRMTVFPAAGDGGLRGDVLVVPPIVTTFDAPDDNAALALARVVLGAVAARTASAPAAGTPPAVVAACSLAALAGAITSAAIELPGLGPLLDGIRPGLVAARPVLLSCRGPDRALEVLVRLALGQPIEQLTDESVDAGWLETAAMWLRAPTSRMPAEIDAAIAGGRAAVVPLFGWLGAPDVGPTIVSTPHRPGESGRRGGRERQARARDRVKRRELDERRDGENPLTHSFEKVHTLERYQGGRKQIDGADELDAHGDALDELDLDEVVRSSTTTASVYRAEVLGLDGTGELAADGPPLGEAIAYDEWDEVARRYRVGWCQVRIEAQPTRAAPDTTARFVAGARATYRRERRELAAQIARLDERPVRLGRQADGPEVDVDAIVDRHGALRHGTTGPDRLYVAYRRRPPELAVVLLLDRSLSSDAWIGGRRVLDVATGALVALGEGLDHVAASTAILAFHSHTRRDCRIAMIKSFEAPWAAAHARLAALEPVGYTRIGPAMRHATALLGRTPARRKLLVLLSDGKPTDYDRYEGRYGLADVRRSIYEASTRGIHAFGLALDARAGAHLPGMFGRGGFAVVSRPPDLVAAMGRLYRERLAA